MTRDCNTYYTAMPHFSRTHNQCIQIQSKLFLTLFFSTRIVVSPQRVHQSPQSSRNRGDHSGATVQNQGDLARKHTSFEYAPWVPTDEPWRFGNDEHSGDLFKMRQVRQGSRFTDAYTQALHHGASSNLADIFNVSFFPHLAQISRSILLPVNPINLYFPSATSTRYNS